MNKFFKSFDWSFKSIAKITGMVILGIVALTVVISLISFSFKTILGGTGNRYYEQGAKYNYAMEEMEMSASPAMLRMKGGMPIVPPTPGGDYSTGSDAEDFEIKEYNSTIKTRKLDKTCNIIAELKSFEYIIFETSEKNKNSCYYKFKAEKDKAEEIVTLIENLDPETFNARIQTIKKVIEGYEDELEILNKKLTSIEETLENAQKSYDDISKIATRQQDAETLAKIIDSKLKLIDKLSRERLNVKERNDRYNKSKAQQLDRLNYTFFNVRIYEDLIFDWEDIKDSWKYEAKAFVRNFNEVIEGISIHLITYVIRFAQVVIYIFLSLFLLKFVWIGIKKIWKGKKK